MSNRQLDEQADARRDIWIAKMLGVEVDDLDSLDLSIEEITGSDDAFYGYRAIVGPDADEDLVEERLQGARAIHLGNMPDDEEREPDID